MIETNLQQTARCCDHCGTWKSQDDVHMRGNPEIHEKDVLVFCNGTPCEYIYFKEKELEKATLSPLQEGAHKAPTSGLSAYQRGEAPTWC